MRTLAQLTLLILMLFSCKKETTAPVTPPDSSNRINFADPQVGQKSYYRKFEGVGYYQFLIPSMTYLEDTLVVELVQNAAGNAFLLKEYYTAGSKPFSWIVYEDSAVFTPIFITQDSVLIPKLPNYCCGNQSLIAFGEAQVLDLKPFTQLQLEIESWKTNASLSGSVVTGYAQNDTINGSVYPHLNIAIDDTATSADGNGHTLVYEKSNGIVRTSVINPWWGGAGTGFDLIK